MKRYTFITGLRFRAVERIRSGIVRCFIERIGRDSSGHLLGASLPQVISKVTKENMGGGGGSNFEIGNSRGEEKLDTPSCLRNQLNQ